MELPAYRLPTIRNILYHMWDKARHYLRKIATIILAGVIIIWALEYFPRETKNTQSIQQQITLAGQNSNLSPAEKEIEIQNLNYEMEADRLSNSYLGRFGRTIEPVMKPLGFDWKMSIALLAGLPAKEIIISTMGVIYQTDNTNSTEGLQQKLRSEKFASGEVVFTTTTALAFLVFILIYFPCIGVVGAIKNESGSWKWAAFAVFYTTSLAWIAAFLVQTIGGLL